MTSRDPFHSFAESLLRPGRREETLESFRALGRVIRTDRDRPIIPLDEDREQFVFVAEGATKLGAHASAGREQVVAFQFAGDLVYMPQRGAHAYTLAALTPCALLAFPAQQFLDAARQDARVLDIVLARTMRALQRCREKSIALGSNSASERLANFLVDMAGRIGSCQDQACILNLPMSRRDIADYLGMTIETVSRQLSMLRALGLIETSGRSIVRLLDVDALTVKAGHLSAAA